MLNYSCTKNLLLIDAYDFEWTMPAKDGQPERSGVTPKVVVYDYDKHETYFLNYDCDLSQCDLLNEYQFTIEFSEHFGRKKETVVGVELVRA